MNSVAIIQARMSSNRLPGKVMMKVGGKTLVERTIDAAKSSKNIKKIYVATSESKSDDILSDFLATKNVEVYRGSLNNVFSRYYKIASLEKKSFDSVVRLTADCPLLDPKVIDETIEEHYLKKYEYTSTGLSNTYPVGQAVEVISISTLLGLDEKLFDEEDFEHVTRFIWKREKMFKCGSKKYKQKKYPECNKLRLTVDQIEDLNLVEKIIEGLNYENEKSVCLEDIIEFLYLNPKLIEINSEVKQIEV